MQTISTPWGTPQSTREIMPGVTQISTAGHGGLHLSPDRQELLDLKFSFNPFAGHGWYEEDLDWAAVTIAFHSEDTEDAVFHAVEIALAGSERFEDVRRYLYGTDEGRHCLSVYEKIKKQHQNDWRVSFVSSNVAAPHDIWNVGLRRGGERITINMPYPEKAFYTDQEIEELEYVPSAN